MEKISVIIPVYNGEKHLSQCIESVLQQQHTNLEIIIINDGSSDGSAAIIEQYRRLDQRIRVLHKAKNEGLGAARNSSLEIATGDYICFIDCDDWMDPNHVSDLYDLICRTQSDIAVCNFTQYIEDEGRYIIHIQAEDYYEKTYTPQEWFAFQYGMPHFLSSCFTVPWVKLYKKELFENILYFTDGFGEDDRTTWKLYLVADKIAYMNATSLVYRVNSASMTQTANQATVFSEEPVFERLATLGLIGFDISKEIKAFEWRAHINQSDALSKGQIKKYKQLKFLEQITKKYRG